MTLPYFPWRHGLPSARRGHAMAAAGDGSVWLHGGYTAAGPSDQLVKLDPQERRWHAVTTAGPRPSARRGHSRLVAVDGHTLVLFGGDTKSGYSDELWTLDLLAAAAWTRLTASASGASAAWPSARWGHTMVTVGSAVLMFGGWTDSGYSDELWSLNVTVAASAWTRLTASASGASDARPSARDAHTMVTVGSSVLMFGGSTVSGFSDELWSLEQRAWRWTLLNDVNVST